MPFDIIVEQNFLDGLLIDPAFKNKSLFSLSNKFDDIGNLISDETKVLTWTVDGLLESVTAGDVNTNFTYDALNRRVEKKVYINEMLNKTTEYVYDNWQVIEERSGANVKSFVYGDYIDEVVYFENTGVGYYPLRGVNFNIEALTNSSGDLVETYAIDAFGNFKVFDADGFEKALSDRLNSILYQGRDYDDDVGMWLIEIKPSPSCIA